MQATRGNASPDNPGTARMTGLAVIGRFPALRQVVLPSPTELCSTALSGCVAAPPVVPWPGLFHSFGLPTTCDFQQGFIQVTTGAARITLTLRLLASRSVTKMPEKRDQNAVPA
jgi:hypothetical protein